MPRMKRSSKPDVGRPSSLGVQRLLEIMAERDIHQAELARMIGCNRSAMNKWLHGDRTPDLPFRFVMDERFGISLRAWDEPPKPKPRTRRSPSGAHEVGASPARHGSKKTGTDDE
jgi:transcriptional regulator with XRE-family HTH domain